ncbi:unnamed protein product, partial [Adineta steineri]
RNNLTEKPSFRAVKNLISILNDKGSSFAPNALTYTLTGNLTNVRQLLFQKRNGDFYLMIWNEVSSWDVAHKFDLYSLPQQLQLSLQNDYILADATLYTFNNNADLQTINLSINNNQINFNATDTVSIIRLKNGTNSSSGTSTTAGTEIGGVYRITPKYAPQSGLYAIGDQNSAFVSQSQYSGGTNQQWIVESLTDGYYRITNRAGTRVLNVYGCNRNDGGVIQLHDWLDSDCQKWKFELLSNGYYRITPKHALNQSLDVQMCTTVGGIIVQQWSWSNSECQQWKLEKIGLVV